MSELTTFTVAFRVDREELERAILFLGTPPEKVQEVIEDYYTGKKVLKLPLITDEHKRYYHTNGLCAMILCIQDDIQKSIIQVT